MDGTGSKELMIDDGKYIYWDYWKAAYEWDSTQNACHRVHPRLTSAALELDTASKMKNSYAQYALNSDMLNLMTVSGAKQF